MDMYLAAIRYSKPDTTRSHRVPASLVEEDAYYAQFNQPFFDPRVGRLVKFIAAGLSPPKQPAAASPRRSVRHA